MLQLPSLYQRVLPILLLASTVVACTLTATPPHGTSSPSVASSATSDKKPLVVATTSVICDLAKEIAKDTVNLKCLMGAGSDPHVYQPTPADRQAIESAKLMMYGGYDLEPTLIKIIKATTNNAPKVAINEVAVPSPLTMEEDGNKATDPHIWHSAQNGIKIVAAIQSSLTQAVPAQADRYSKNAQALTTQIGQLDTWIKAQIATIPSPARKLVTTHDSLGYYANAYGIPVEGALQGLSTDEKPTPIGIKKLVDEIRKTGVPTIFGEVTASSKLLEQVAKEANVKISPRALFADGLGTPGSGAETYAKMLMANTQAIVEGLGGKFEPFVAK